MFVLVGFNDKTLNIYRQVFLKYYRAKQFVDFCKIALLFSLIRLIKQISFVG